MDSYAAEQRDAPSIQIYLSLRARYRWSMQILIALIAVAHLGFLVLEMFLWQTPYTLKAFHMTPQQASDSATLAKNQGLYNGFLAAGLIWSLVAEPAIAGPVRLFFLSCVLVAGIFGGATANRRIFIVQALPAAFAVALHFCA